MKNTIQFIFPLFGSDVICLLNIFKGFRKLVLVMLLIKGRIGTNLN